MYFLREKRIARRAPDGKEKERERRDMEREREREREREGERGKRGDESREKAKVDKEGKREAP